MRTTAAALLPLAILAAGCGSIAPRPETPGPRESLEPPAPQAQPVAPAGAARRGAYYLDDGPGDGAPADLSAIPDAQPRDEPLHRFANNPYSVFGRSYVPLRERGPWKERGTGSWYGRRYHGQPTSSGERYDMYAMTAAHPTLPIPSYARVTNLQNARSVVVRINDRGPFHSDRIVDLSYTAAWKLGFVERGSAPLEVEAIVPGTEPPPRIAAPGPTLSDSAIPLADGAGGVYLQLGAFSARDNAESFRTRMSQGLAWLQQTLRVLSADGLHRVHLGPFRDRAEANAAAERIRSALDLRAVVVTR